MKSKDIGREISSSSRPTLRQPLSSFTEQLNEMHFAAKRRMLEEQRASALRGQDDNEGNQNGRRISISVQSNLRGLFNLHKESASKEEDEKHNLFDDAETFRQRDISGIAGQYNMPLPAVDTLYDWFERLQPERVLAVPPTPPTWSPRRRRRRSSIARRFSTGAAPKDAWGSERQSDGAFTSEGSPRHRVLEKAPLEIARALGDTVDEDAARFRNFMQELLKTNPEVQQMTSAWEIRKFIRAKQCESKADPDSDGD